MLERSRNLNRSFDEISMTSRSACVTDYEHLYARGYYAHADGATSFDVARLPALVAQRSSMFGRAVLDLGGGNGELGRALSDYRVKTLTIDAADRQEADYIRLDLSRYDPQTVEIVRRRIYAYLGDAYLSTCFDVGEHIDLEHIGQFILNTAALVDRECVISISTRPSSAANRYHPSVLPIATWQYLFSLAGFSSEPDVELQSLRSNHRFRSSDANLIAVAHWQRLDPFRENSLSHQHYLRLKRFTYELPAAREILECIDEVLDVKYRRIKRQSISAIDIPTITFNVNFIQDWSFARSLMDICPAGQFQVVIRNDIIAEPYCYMLCGLLERTGCRHMSVSNVAEAVVGFDTWGDFGGTLAITATEGVPSVTHLMGSLMMLEIAQRGAQTLCLQHGMTVLSSQTPASAVIGVWSDDEVDSLRTTLSLKQGPDIMCTGSTKFLDALLPSSRNVLEFRFGVMPGDFSQIILVGLNLHWAIHQHSAEETLSWLERLSAKNQDTLFIIRPHPDDSSIYSAEALLSKKNVMLLDEMLLLSMDMQISRILKGVDAVITTYSTLAIDAVAAGKPVILLPFSKFDHTSTQYLKKSAPWISSGIELPVLDHTSWSKGEVPNFRLAGNAQSSLSKSSWFNPSLNSIQNICSLAARSLIDRNEDQISRMSIALASAIKSLCLDKNPHRDRELVTRAIQRFIA